MDEIEQGESEQKPEKAHRVNRAALRQRLGYRSGVFAILNGIKWRQPKKLDTHAA
ncbi:MAG TPA: hypothetical protein VG965_02395 [Patescibacteria group bacterium]|nr:hypothetical protein [Patescibacteria group bacterium]